MDTTNFLLEREKLLQQMEERRAQAAEAAQDARSGILPWMFLTGASFISGVRSNPGLRKLLRTLIWAAVAPVVLGVINRQNSGLVHRLFDAVFPSARTPEALEK
jgi:hypothetical protein